MSDKKLTYGKGLTALKKKFNTGGRVNARSGGIKEFTGFQQIPRKQKSFLEVQVKLLILH
jgi:hypothetical protein